MAVLNCCLLFIVFRRSFFQERIDCFCKIRQAGSCCNFFSLIYGKISQSPIKIFFNKTLLACMGGAGLSGKL